MPGFPFWAARTSRLIRPSFRSRACSIMLAGIVIQLAIMVFYVLYMAIWAWKAKVQVKRAGRRIEIMLLGMFVASVGIIVRGVSPCPTTSSVFRDVAEALILSERSATVLRSGWIAQQQIWQLFDAIPVAFSSYILKYVLIPPGLCFPASSDDLSSRLSRFPVTHLPTLFHSAQHHPPSLVPRLPSRSRCPTSHVRKAVLCDRTGGHDCNRPSGERDDGRRTSSFCSSVVGPCRAEQAR
jgi:hypothetical protein